MKKKLIIVLLVVLVVGGVAYKMEVKPKPTKMRIAGAVYTLPQDFLINLSDGQFAKLAVTLVLEPGQSDGASAAAADNTTTTSNGDTIGTLPEEAVVRAIITNTLTNETGTALLNGTTRAQIESQILQAIDKQTDVKVAQVLFPDLTVQ
jgi:flagellar basal body-associated protein FliL